MHGFLCVGTCVCAGVHVMCTGLNGIEILQMLHTDLEIIRDPRLGGQ